MLMNILFNPLYSGAKILGIELGICFKRGVSQHEPGSLVLSAKDPARRPWVREEVELGQSLGEL